MNVLCHFHTYATCALLPYEKKVIVVYTYGLKISTVRSLFGVTVVLC